MHKTPATAQYTHYRETDMYTIYWTYQGSTEAIDTAEDADEAMYLCGEYQLAYGCGDVYAFNDDQREVTP